MQRWLIGIDDTDNLESRGTGFKAREMGRLLNEADIIRLLGITRHQLLVDSRIPYTSHNSSACLDVESEKPEDIREFCSDFLIKESADGSDAGLCIAAFENVSEKIIEWGRRAKKEIVTQKEARDLARDNNIFLEGYTGTNGGIIGSLAAVGLRNTGNDGRFLWINGMREITGKFSIFDIKKITGIDEILTIDNQMLPDETEIFLGDWWRPVLKNKKIILFAERKNERNNEWQVVSKDVIKSISS